MVSPLSALSTNPILEFLRGSPLDDFLFLESSSSASCRVSRSIYGGYFHCLLVSPFFNFSYYIMIIIVNVSITSPILVSYHY